MTIKLRGSDLISEPQFFTNPGEQRPRHVGTVFQQHGCGKTPRVNSGQSGKPNREHGLFFVEMFRFEQSLACDGCSGRKARPRHKIAQSVIQHGEGLNGIKISRNGERHVPGLKIGAMRGEKICPRYPVDALHCPGGGKPVAGMIK